MAGGCHHARPARASGFSYLNDAAVAMTKLVQRGLRVAYIDLDAHHGDAVQQAFYDSNRVLTISLHETGKDFYPHTGFVTEMGEGDGYGYAVNIPFLRHADDLIFEQAFSRVVLPLLTAFKPDLLFTQMGVDGLRTDPLTRLEFTTRSVEFATRAFLATGLPWVAVGGGGYDCFNVARSWTLFWGVATGSPLPDELPPEFDRKGPDPDSSPGRLRDLPHLAHPDDFSRAQAELERVLGFLERRLLPLHEIRRAWGR
jgi:acetoin utilization protein AcuC